MPNPRRCGFQPQPHRTMKTAPFFRAARVSFVTLFVMTAIVLAVLAISGKRSMSATPAAGSIGTGGPALAWDGTAAGTGSASGESTCVEGVNCDSFILTVTGTQADWAAAGKRIEVKIAP